MAERYSVVEEKYPGIGTVAARYLPNEEMSDGAKQVDVKLNPGSRMCLHDLREIVDAEEEKVLEENPNARDEDVLKPLWALSYALRHDGPINIISA